MRLAFKKKQTDAREQAEFPAELYEYQQKQEFMHKSVQTLLKFIEEFALDLKELGSDAFKRDINSLGEKFDECEALRKTQTCFHKQKKNIRLHWHKNLSERRFD